ncbi:hypothetical protein ACIRYZ_37880 [Kitasatospora sp. NPDC101155]|uniref:hypothetical protein n=1 Tax=Kitasatospora sp. NPDC101155 TaxID=3364097 RepID=UPI003810A72F
MASAQPGRQVRVRENTLVLHTLLWPDELRSPGGIAPADIELQEKELVLARTLMDAISEDLHLETEHDDYAHALEDIVAAKLRGIEPPHPAGALPPATGQRGTAAVGIPTTHHIRP